MKQRDRNQKRMWGETIHWSRKLHREMSKGVMDMMRKTYASPPTPPPPSVVRWQGTPPEATTIINAVIEWTHIFISYWFISNSPLILGGHHCAVAFLLPGLRFSAPPAITVVITALPPRKLFTVSYLRKKRMKKWVSVVETNAKERREKKKSAVWRRAIKSVEAITFRRVRSQNTIQMNFCCCAISVLIVKVLNVFNTLGVGWGWNRQLTQTCLFFGTRHSENERWGKTWAVTSIKDCEDEAELVFKTILDFKTYGTRSGIIKSSSMGCSLFSDSASCPPSHCLQHLLSSTHLHVL